MARWSLAWLGIVGFAAAASAAEPEPVDDAASVPGLESSDPIGETAGEAAEVEVEVAEPPVVLEGVVLEAGVRTPLSFVNVAVVGEGLEEPIEGQSGPDGAFAFAGLPPGQYRLVVTGRGIDPTDIELEITEGRVTEVKVFAVLSRPWEAVDGELVVVGRRVEPEITERILDAKKVYYLPGTNGDVVRVVQNLPGVARPPLNIGQLLVRGTDAADSRYYLDGGRLPLVFHFAGFSTVVNGDSLREIAFLPGNYGTRYGRTLGGAVDLRASTDIPERSSGYVSVDLFQTTAFVSQRLSDRTAITVSGRRSYVDTILGPILNSGDGPKVQAPRYLDLQTRLLHQLPGQGGTFDAMFLLSDDRFRILGEAEEGQADSMAFRIGLSTTFGKLRLQWRRSVGDWQVETTLIGGPERQDFEISPAGEAFEQTIRGGLRHEWFVAPDDEGSFGIGLRAGLDLEASYDHLLYDVFGPREEIREWTLEPGVYAEPTVRVGPVQLTPGLRLDPIHRDSGFTRLAIDPRMSARVEAGYTTVIKGSLGQYSQFPLVRETSTDGLGTTDLVAQRSIQASVGLEQEIGPKVKLEAVAFHAWLRDLVVGREDRFEFYTGPPPLGPFDVEGYVNEGRGRVLGLETLLRLDTRRTTAWLAATLSRSLRTGRDGDKQLFTYDQPVVLTALGSHQLPKRWRLGARARFGSGNPYTAVVNRYLDLATRSYVPVYGERDGERLSPFFSLDLRVDKEWVFKKWSLGVYLDVQNATNMANVEVMGWTFDYAEPDPVTSLPVLPAFGFKGAW